MRNFTPIIAATIALLPMPSLAQSTYQDAVAEDVRFIQMYESAVEQHGQYAAPSAVALKLGHAICGALRAGVSMDEIDAAAVRAIETHPEYIQEPLQWTQAFATVAGVYALCPEYKSSL